MYIVNFNGADHICATFSQTVAMARKSAEHGVVATIFDDEGEQVASFQPREETK
jgi:hypothetical protein